MRDGVVGDREVGNGVVGGGEVGEGEVGGRGMLQNLEIPLHKTAKLLPGVMTGIPPN